jgi:hypothetical protein
VGPPTPSMRSRSPLAFAWVRPSLPPSIPSFFPRALHFAASSYFLFSRSACQAHLHTLTLPSVRPSLPPSSPRRRDRPPPHGL